MARLAHAWDQPVEEHARRLQQIHVQGALDPGILMVEIASLQAHLALDAGRRERRLELSLSAATWALAVTTAVLAGVAIWG